MARKIRVKQSSVAVSVVVAVLTFPIFCAELGFLATVAGAGIDSVLDDVGIHLGAVGWNIVILVLSVAVLASAGLLSRHVYVTMRWKNAEIGGRYCVQCQYDLTGNVSGRCPECGLELTDDGGAERS
ncbi:MAG: hypothetical protein PVJ57_20670 [Phycisphaerae bacterium]|jgi:hypothetical protein